MVIKIKKIRKTKEFWFEDCICCGKDMDDIVDEGDDFYEIQFIKSKSKITMCKKCFEDFAKDMNKNKERDESTRYMGLRDKRIDVPIATLDEIKSDNWITNKEACERYGRTRSTIDTLRRRGIVDAKRLPGANVIQANKLDFPHEGYIYNVESLNKYFESKKQSEVI